MSEKSPSYDTSLNHHNDQPVLDPGPPAHRPRRRSCLSLCWICGKLSILIVALITVGSIGFLIWGFLKYVRDPHREMMWKEKVNGTEGLSTSTKAMEIVKPLVGKGQRFDVAVTVWARAAEDEERVWKEELKAQRESELLGGDSDEMKKEELEYEYAILEKPLFSNIVFRGLSLDDRNVRAEVPLSIPLAKFRDQNLTLMDLRGSFVLIPTPPSPLDRLVSYSSIYRSLGQRPRLPRPFPLGSTYTSEHTLADKALEQIGISTNLIEFHPVPSRCNSLPISSDSLSSESSSSDREQASTSDPLVSSPVSSSAESVSTGPISSDPFEVLDAEDDDDNIYRVRPVGSSNKGGSVNNEFRKNLIDRHDPSHHPFVVTRTQLVVIDETRMLDLKAVTDKFKRMRAIKCSDPAHSTYLGPGQIFCQHEYKQNGHWEMRMKVTKEGGGGNQTEWVYPPFMYTAPLASGPLDLVPIPVNRENCSSVSPRDETSVKKHWAMLHDSIEDKAEYLNVTWKISFSGQRPIHTILGGMFRAAGRPDVFADNTTRYESHEWHDFAEVMNALAGHRFSDDSHPIRRFTVYVLGILFSILLHLVNIHYFYTRTSSYGLSLPGTLILSASSIISSLATSITEIPGVFKVVDFSTNVVAATVGLMVGLGMSGALAVINALPGVFGARTVLKFEVEWRPTGGAGRVFRWMKGMGVKVPVLKKVRMNHRERASRRADGRTDWKPMAGLYLALSIYFFLYPYAHFLRSPSILADPKEDEYLLKKRLWAAVVTPAEFVGPFYQFLLNKRLGTFGGSYRLTALFTLFVHFLALLRTVSAFTGRYNVMPGVTTYDALLFIVASGMAWQAATMRAGEAGMKSEDEDEDEE